MTKKVKNKAKLVFPFFTSFLIFKQNKKQKVRQQKKKRNEHRSVELVAVQKYETIFFGH